MSHSRKEFGSRKRSKRRQKRKAVRSRASLPLPSGVIARNKAVLLDELDQAPPPTYVNVERGQVRLGGTFGVVGLTAVGSMVAGAIALLMPGK